MDPNEKHGLMRLRNIKYLITHVHLLKFAAFTSKNPISFAKKIRFFLNLMRLHQYLMKLPQNRDELKVHVKIVFL